MALGTIIEIIADGSYYLYFPFQAWLYLFSPEYRKNKAEKWKNSRSSLVIQEVIGLILGFIISILFSVIICYYLIKIKAC